MKDEAISTLVMEFDSRGQALQSLEYESLLFPKHYFRDKVEELEQTKELLLHKVESLMQEKSVITHEQQRVMHDNEELSNRFEELTDWARTELGDYEQLEDQN